MDRPELKTALVTRGHTRALKDGTIKPRTFDFAFEEVPVIIKAFRRMVRGVEFDISEMALTTYVCARAHGKPFLALPVFLTRALHHGSIVVHENAGVCSPKDLEGRKVGVHRGYTVTTGLWARSILQDQYGVDLTRITWVLSGDEHVAEYRPPSNVVPIEPGQTVEALLASGELAAAVGLPADTPGVKPLIPEAREAGFEALRARGLYPIKHTVVVREDLLVAQPDLARDAFEAFAQAKREYVQRLTAGAIEQPSDEDRFYARVMEIAGDPLPYGIEPNRSIIESLIRHAVAQQIISRPMAIEQLFPPSTRGLTA
jgi:4,5-dihydroxyphthalate decarboxylase